MIKTPLTSLALAVLAGTSATQAAVLVFDSMTGNGSALAIPGGGGSTASTGNRFMGEAITLGSSNLQISGFDATILNNTGATLNVGTGWQGSLNYSIWNTWNSGATGSSPVFSNLAGSGSATFGLASSFAWVNNSFLAFGASPFTAALATPPLAITPVTVSSTGPIGITLNYTLNKNDGNGFQAIGGLTFVVASNGATAVPPAVGTDALGGANLGYYRSAAGENNGNFQADSKRTPSANSGLLFRVYGQAVTPVPEPSEYAALAGLGLVAFGAWRRLRK